MTDIIDLNDKKKEKEETSEDEEIVPECAACIIKNKGTLFSELMDICFEYLAESPLNIDDVITAVDEAKRELIRENITAIVEGILEDREKKNPQGEK